MRFIGQTDVDYIGGLAGRLSKASPEINKNSFPYINNKQVNSSMKILPKYRVAVPPSRQKDTGL